MSQILLWIWCDEKWAIRNVCFGGHMDFVHNNQIEIFSAECNQCEGQKFTYKNTYIGRNHEKRTTMIICYRWNQLNGQHKKKSLTILFSRQQKNYDEIIISFFLLVLSPPSVIIRWIIILFLMHNLKSDVHKLQRWWQHSGFSYL